MYFIATADSVYGIGMFNTKNKANFEKILSQEYTSRTFWILT